MPAPLSIVIPTLNAAHVLPACLEALYEGVAEGLVHELILTDGGSQDPTARIAKEAGARLITGAPSRGGQLARGCAAASAEWVLVLHADTVLSPGWSETVRTFLPRQGPACFRLRFEAPGMGARMVAGWANLRTRLFNLPYGDQGLLIPRRLYQQVGGYRDIALMEDVALVRALGQRITLLPVTATTGAERYLSEGWIRRGAKNLGTLLRYFCGVPPEKLAARYGRSAK